MNVTIYNNGRFVSIRSFVSKINESKYQIKCIVKICFIFYEKFVKENTQANM